MSAATSIDGVQIDRYMVVEGETFRVTAEGPSFYNGLGKFSVEKVNAGESIHGTIGKDGHLYIAAQWTLLSGYLPIGDLRLAVAFGRFCADEDFRALIAAVNASHDERETG